MGSMIIFGAGGHGKVVLEAALEAGMAVEEVVDDAPACDELLGVRVQGAASYRWDRRTGHRFIVGVGVNEVRARLFRRLLDQGLTAASVIHPAAIVSRHAQVGAGTFVGAGAVVMVGSLVGDDAIVNTAASVDHDCRIGDHVHLCPGVRLAGEVSVGAFSMIGTGASVLPGMRIGAHCVIGAGAVVTRDVPAHSLAVGVPARVVRREAVAD